MTNTVHDLTTFGGLLADLRERRGLSQAELAARSDMHTQKIANLEDGAWQVDRDEIPTFATALSLDADDTGRLYVAAGLLPPGSWCWVDGWVIRPNKEAPIAQ